MVNDGVQTNSQGFDPNSSMLGENKRRADGFFLGHHNGWIIRDGRVCSEYERCDNNVER